MDKFVVKVKKKIAWVDSRICIRIPCETHETLKKLSGETNIPITRLMQQMVDFCMERIEIVMDKGGVDI